jgi:hypothetical protein
LKIHDIFKKRNIIFQMSRTCTTSGCYKIHSDILKNGNPAKTCSKCREREKIRRTNFKIPDENGMIGCFRCGTRMKPEDFPFKLNDPHARSVKCLPCLNESIERSNMRMLPFKKQLEDYKKKCIGSEKLIRENDEHFDHFCGEKIRNVTEFMYWATIPGKSKEERLRLHLLELEKTQRVSTSEHLEITSQRRGPLSMSYGALKQRKERQNVKEENWEFIERVQRKLCGCGCGVELTQNTHVEFDHDLKKGPKLFNMGHARTKSKQAREIERSKGLFLLPSCHRRMTKKRCEEAREERINNFKKLKI